MPRVKLTGLFLFITTLCIGMAAAATKTTHIRFKRSDRVVAAEQAAEGEVLPPGQPGQIDQAAASQIQFMSVPVIYPLLTLGFFGLLLWFVPGDNSRSSSRQRSSRRRSRSRKTAWSILPRKRSRR